MSQPNNPQPHWAARQRFYDQKGRAGYRGIEWKLTFDQWYQWWLDQGVDKDYPTALDRNQLCMCRPGDAGPYSLDNIYCGTRSENTRERNATKPNLGHKGVTGVKHPRHGLTPKVARAVHTPLGDFPSMTHAYRAEGCKIDRLKTLIRKHPDQYYFIEKQQ